MTPDELQLAKAGIEQAFKPYQNLIEKLLGPSFEDLGEGFRTGPALWRKKRELRLWKKTQDLIREAGFEPQPVPPKLLLPIIQNACLEEDDSLQDKYAALLANAAAPNSQGCVLPAFPEILRQLTSIDVKFLDRLFQKALVTPSELEFSGKPYVWPLEERIVEIVSKFSLGTRADLRAEFNNILPIDESDDEGAKYNKEQSFALCLDNLVRLGLLIGDSVDMIPERLKPPNPTRRTEYYGFCPLGASFVASCAGVRAGRGVTMESKTLGK